MKIALSIILAFFILGCSEDTKQEVEKTEPKKVVVKESTVETPVVSEVKTQTPTVAQVKEDAIEVASNSIEIVKEEFSNVVDAAQDVTESATSSVTQKVKEVIAVVKVSTPTPNIDAKALYNACASCHGVNGEKAALGKSQIIKGWSVEKVTNAINGYKDGTYGGSMKGLMKGQVAKLNADETKAISEYISKL